MSSRWGHLPSLVSVEDLEVFGRPEAGARDRVEACLEEVHREWIAARPLALMATASADGRCDVSPRGDPPGFIKMLDEHTIAIPERAGNKRMDGCHNLLTNRGLGLLLVIPGRPDTMRLNGCARPVSDGPFFEEMVVRGHRPRLAILVGVEEAFFHGPKAFVRAGPWNPRAWRPDAARRYARIAKALWRRDEALPQIESRLTPDVIEKEHHPREA